MAETSSIPTTLFHYTSLEVLDRILDSQKLRLNDANKMNDYSEGRWIERHIRSVVESKAIPEKQKSDFYSLYERNRISRPACLFCLSEEQELLSQWTRYAEDGEGVSIGFSMTNSSIAQRIPSPRHMEFHSIGIAPVIYDSEYQHDTVQQILDDLEKDGFENTNAKVLAIRRLLACGLIFKSHGFIEEKEWRIIDAPTPEMGLAKTEGLRTRKPYTPQFDFDISRNNMKRFTSVQFSKITEESDYSFICSVKLGPRCPISKLEVEQFLAGKYGIETIEVSKSEIPYRGR